MKTLLFATVTASVMALALPIASAQVSLPAAPVTPPPIVTPQPNTPGVATQAAPETAAETQAATDAQAPVTAPTTTHGAVTGSASTAPEAPARLAGQASVATPNAQAQASTSPATPAAASPAAQAAATTPATTTTASAAPQTAAGVCGARTTSVNFASSASALNVQNANALEYAVDGASVCSLQGVTISTGDGRLAQRRAADVRHRLIARGVPEDKITVETTAAASAPNAVDVRMSFNGVSSASGSAAATPTEQPG